MTTIRSAAILFLSAVVAAGASDRYAVVLNDPAAGATASRSDTAAFSSARARARSAHDPIRRELASRNIRITAETDTILNAVFVEADAVEAAALRGLPGIRQVTRLPRLHPSLDAAEQLINVPAAWSLLGGIVNAGAGIRIAVLDTGIQSTHPAFQDTAVTPPAGYPLCDVMTNCAFTNNKIIVARSYVQIVGAGSPTNPATDSRPDDLSARDRVGHGTAVAMAAAGVSNTGPADTIAGVAPKAFLGNYKVFGSPGVLDYTSGDAIIAALEDAYNDHMDIASLSLGSPAVYGPLDTGAACGLPAGQYCDVIAATIENLTGMGMVVVAAAGNGGNRGFGTLDSPGDAPGAIGVAAVNNGHVWVNGILISGLGTYFAQMGDGPLPSAPSTARLSDVSNIGDPQACSPFPPGSLTGTIALIQRNTCTFLVKVQNAQAAGAVGVIFTNASAGDSVVAPSGLAGQTSIPAALIGYSDGQTIRSYLNSNPSTMATITSGIVPTPAQNASQLASFSSSGPALGATPSIKPDVSAVGTNLYLAGQNYDPNGGEYASNGYLVAQGTSFSTPQIAGLAALVLQNNPSLAPSQVKSAIVNTAVPDVTSATGPASVLGMGAGRANAAAALGATLFASPSSAWLGVLRASGLPASQQIQLTNTSASGVALSVVFNRRTPETTAHIAVDQPNLQIPAGGSASIILTVSGTVPSPGIYEGFVQLQQNSGTLLSIPFAYVVASGVAATVVPVAGNGDIGIPGQQNSEGGLLGQVLDQFGAPVQGLPVTFSVSSGGGSLSNSDLKTDNYGFAGTNDVLGPNPGINVFGMSAGGVTGFFNVNTYARPVISPSGAVNAANYALQPVAPGSYIALFGNNLAPSTQSFSTTYLPVALGYASVSFDTPSVSAPGHMTYASPGQIVVQVPWELQTALAAGQTAAQIKASFSFNSGVVYNLPIAPYSPAFFEISTGFVAALDQNNILITTSHGVPQGTVVQLFLNGLGPVTNQPASGDPASTTVLSYTTSQPTVSIGGINAPVIFSGLTPGTIGLYQVNATVPKAGSGLQPITITIGGVTSTVSHVQIQ